MTRHKNAHGEGYVSKKPRKDGRWAAALTIDGRRFTRYGHTLREARAELAALKRARDQGAPVASERVTLGEYLAAWLDTARAGQAVSTQRGYEVMVRRHITPHLGRVRLARLTPDHLRRLYVELGATLAPGTIGLAHTVLSAALGQAQRDGTLPRNVAQLVRPPRVPAYQFTPLSAEQARAFLAAARDDRLEALWVLLATTGARIGELLAARWSDVDVEHRTLGLHGSLLQVPVTSPVDDLKVYTSGGKSRRSQRPVQLLAVALAALQRRRTAQREERLAAGPQWQETGDWLFTGPMGRPLLYATVNRQWFKPLARRAGLPATTTPHDLRHAVATLLLAEGVHPRLVADLLGHSRTELTTDKYPHVAPTLQAQASAVLERVLGA